MDGIKHYSSEQIAFALTTANKGVTNAAYLLTQCERDLVKRAIISYERIFCNELQKSKTMKKGLI